MKKAFFVTLFFAVVGLVARGAEAAVAAVPASGVKPVLFNTAFESGSIGLIEKLNEEEFRLHVRGQQDARGRNRQATWFYFRMDDVANRDLTVRLAAFRGECNERPSTPAGAWMRPVFSFDGEKWEHFKDAEWDTEKAELTSKVRVPANRMWIA